MNRKQIHKISAWILTAVCCLGMTVTAWAGTGSAPGSDDTSHMIVTSAAARREAELKASADLALSGPGVPSLTRPLVPDSGRKGSSLGMFTTTGYCGGTCCCSNGSGLTYSGTAPQANHTISADINRFPIGTRLMINNVIYTVEDVGANVTENCIDIFYNTHAEALEHGTKTEEVFTVITQ